MAKRKKRIVSMAVLPGQPTDGSGRVCVHLFVQNEAGPFVEPHALHPVLDENGTPIKQQVQAKPTRGRLACSAKRTVAPVVRDNVTIVTVRTDNPHAVTCPKCIDSVFYKELMARISAAHEGSTTSATT